MTLEGPTSTADRRGTSRRAVLRLGAATAWTTPVILAATTAPAAAASGALTFVSGTTRVVDIGNFYDVTFTGASLVCSGRILANELVLTVTFTPTSGDTTMFKYAAAPSGWASTSANGASTLVYTRSAASSPGVPVAFPNGAYFGTNTNTKRGTFLLTFTAPGAATTSFSISTPTTPAGRLSVAPTIRTR